jgi:hypothetical protein
MNTPSQRIHEQAAAALDRLFKTGEITLPAEAPELAALHAAAALQTFAVPDGQEMVLQHEGCRYRVRRRHDGLLAVRNWQWLPLSIGLAQDT